MVDALRDAWRVLRPRGFVVELRPSVTYQPVIAIRQQHAWRTVGTVRREVDEGIVGARRAVRRAVNDGWFAPAVRREIRWRSRYRDLAALRRLARENADGWTFAPDLWRRAAAAWPGHVGNDPVAVDRIYSLAVLRKRPRARASS